MTDWNALIICVSDPHFYCVSDSPLYCLSSTLSYCYVMMCTVNGDLCGTLFPLLIGWLVIILCFLVS